MSRIRVAVISVLAFCLLVGVAIAERKGKLKKTTTTRVYRNADGKLENGASAQKSEDKTSVLIIEDMSEGSLLSIRIEGVQHYLAYPLAKDAAEVPMLVTAPGPACYWNRIRVSAGKSTNLGILERDYFEVKDGPFKDLQLSCDESNLLVLTYRKPSKPNAMPMRPPHVGRLLEYTNLDDGK